MNHDILKSVIYDQHEETGMIEEDGVTIEVVPLYRFLLEMTEG